MSHQLGYGGRQPLYSNSSTLISGAIDSIVVSNDLTAGDDITAVDDVIIGGGLIIQSTTEITAILDEDNMVSDSSISLSTQQATKAYIDAKEHDTLVGLADDDHAQYVRLAVRGSDETLIIDRVTLTGSNQVISGTSGPTIDLSTVNVVISNPGSGGLHLSSNAGDGNGIIAPIRASTAGFSGFQLMTGATIDWNCANVGTGGFQITNVVTSSDAILCTNNGFIYLGSTYPNLLGSGRSLHIANDGEVGYMDSRLQSKNNIIDLPDASWLYNLRPVQFQRRVQVKDPITEIKTPSENEVVPEVSFGFIAEEVVIVQDKICFFENNETKTGLLGITHRDLFAPIIKCLQIQKLEIDSLKGRVTLLEAQ